MKIVCDSEEKLIQVAEKVIEFAKQHVDSAAGNAFVVGLSGDLGSGKTTFTKQFAKILGIDETITSPTFVIQKNFDISFPELDEFKKLFHLDVYRIESDSELASIGWQEMISNPENIVLIEWPEIVAGSLPENVLNIKFTFIDDKTREVEIIEKI